MSTENLTPVNPLAGKTEALQSALQGTILMEGDAEYETARKIWNGMIDRKPLLIVRCTSTADIQHAVKFARKNNLLISVRGGGHNVSGSAVCDAGMMIDLSLMRTINVFAEEKFAVVEMGATWGDFDKATQQYGLATTGGLITTTGVAGLTLGGGVGWLVRKCGLSCDNLMEAEVVTADGTVCKASLSENPDLLWGIRGGGGNFGIVTSIKMQLHEVHTVLGGMILYSREKAKEVIRFYREFIKTAPNELTLYAGLLTSPDGLPVVALVGCYCGNVEEGEAVFKPLRAFETPLVDLIQPLIDLLISQMAVNPSPYSATLIEYYGGAASRAPEGGSSYPHREFQPDLVIISNWPDKQDDEKNINWTRNIWDALQPYLSHKVYVNALGVEGEARVKEAYGENYERLAKLKRKYDPDNIFRMNQNILPA
jgi:FAD/FMN-containing dehydrogenase